LNKLEGARHCLARTYQSFGSSVEEAIAQAEQLLVDKYGCDRAQIEQLIEQAKIENLSPWCAANNF
jgi:hypothetical protein